MVSFRERLTAVLESWGVEVTQDLQDRPYQAVLVIGGTRQLADLWRVRRRGIPIVQRLDGLNWLHRLPPSVRGGTLPLRHWLRAEIANLTLALIRRRLATAVVYQSRFAQDWWERVYGKTPVPHCVIYNGVDLEQFCPQGEHQRPKDRLRVLMVEGTLGGGYEWGLGVAMRLMDELRALQPEWGKRYPQGLELMVVGQVAEAVRQAYQKLSRVPIHWQGRVAAAEIPFLDRSAHLLYSADVHPACPNSVIEALACGLPVLAFESGALPELVNETCGRVVAYGGDAWRLDTPDVAALAQAGVEIALQQEALRAAARARAEACFDVREMAKAYAQVMGIALNASPAPRPGGGSDSMSNEPQGSSSQPGAQVSVRADALLDPRPQNGLSNGAQGSGSKAGAQVSVQADALLDPRPQNGLSNGAQGSGSKAGAQVSVRTDALLDPRPQSGLSNGAQGSSSQPGAQVSVRADALLDPRPQSGMSNGAQGSSSQPGAQVSVRADALLDPRPQNGLSSGVQGSDSKAGAQESDSKAAQSTSLWLVGLGKLSRLTPLTLKRWVYRLPWLANWLRRRVNRAVGNNLQWVEITAGGLRGLSLYLDLSQEKDYWLGTYEPDLQRAIEEWVQAGQTAYDVGANVGYVTLLFARRVGEQGKVIAFEPFPANVHRLKQNLAANAGLAPMEVVAAAVVEAAQTVTFLIGPSDDTGRVVEHGTDVSAGSEQLAVPGVALDALVFEQGYPPPQVVKIDVEGGEVAVLRGMRRLLEQVRPLVLLETHNPACSEAAWQILTQCGYRLCWMKKGYPPLSRPAAWPRRSYWVAFPPP
jgi:FkbM family methyltransferase